MNSESPSTAKITPTLLEYLRDSLAKTAGRASYRVQVFRSQPRRSHALFPHATDLKTKVFQEEVLVVLSKATPRPCVPLQPADSAASETSPVASTSALVETSNSDEMKFLPVLGVEANIYTIPSTRCSIVYISKLDTSGLGQSPAREFVAAFLSYHLLHPPHATIRVRIHLFARAQGQYLFPGSIHNKLKRVLDGKGLVKWWKNCFSLAVDAVKTEIGRDLKLFYLIPRFDYLDSLQYCPNPSSEPAWEYGHSYNTLSCPLYPASTRIDSVRLNDQIPNFPDDPKSRFNNSLTSSVIASSGNEGDYDDIMISLNSATLTTGTTPTARLHEINENRDRERKRLLEGVEGGIEEWWQRMAYRQECGGDTLTGFFVVAGGEQRAKIFEEEEKSNENEPNNKIFQVAAPRKERMAVENVFFTRLWSQFHNVEYTVENWNKLVLATEKWRNDVEIVTRKQDSEQGQKTEQETQQAYEKFVCTTVCVNNEPKSTAPKRVAEEAKPVVVNVLAPRKKKKI